MAENTNTEREAFEKWVVTEFQSIDLTREGDGYYKSLADEWWTAFQAGRASLSLPAAGQEPVTDAMIDAGKQALHNSGARGAREKVERIFKAMSAAAPQPAVAAGWVMVPIEPTESMNEAGSDAGDGHDWAGPDAVYKAMLKAAPLPPAPSTDGA